MTEDQSLAELLADLHAHLEATAELPIRREANLWLGEAEAVAADVAGGDASEETVRARVEQIRTLLERIDETENAAADERVEAALELAAAVENRLGRR
ncbi:hypothetical protein [Halegenticoccus soli]|uniref:hypothetical protein n=1 Tax=Halegenticoccus soli TaxID=1985678 RepID=UPI000C6DEB67|nr:hypothetical protein [Halegenticoccus soli]